LKWERVEKNLSVDLRNEKRQEGDELIVIKTKKSVNTSEE
jgi:hypothetical protein